MSWGNRRESNLSGWQVLRLGNIVPEVGTLQDPNESRPDHMRKTKFKLYHSDAKEENVILELFQVLKHKFLRKLHVHNIIII